MSQEKVRSFKPGIIELLDYCKGGNFNNHIWAWFGNFISSRRDIRVYLFGEELSCLSHTSMCAFHENPDSIYTELDVLTLKVHITKILYAFVVCPLQETV